MELKENDVKLLRYLMYNGRRPDRQIAKELRMSPAIVQYKIRRYEREGIIQGYTYRLNPFKLGYHDVVYFLMKMITPQALDLLVNELMKNPFVTAAFFISGDYDVLIQAFFPSSVALRNFVNWLGELTKDIASTIVSIFAYDTHKMHGICMSEGDMQTIELDEKDHFIIKEKMENPPMTIKQISEKLSLHRNTVSSRWNRLWKERAILKKTVLINQEYYEILGTNFNTVTFISVEPGFEEKVVEELTKRPEIHNLTSISYNFNLLAVVMTRSTTTYQHFIQNLFSIPHVKNSLTNVILSSYRKTLAPQKVNYLPP